MIKVAIIGGPILSGGKKNLIMEYFSHMDKTEVRRGGATLLLC